MAPELVILRNDDDKLPGYGKGVDIWALGICLYILLSGIHPFQIEDEDKMLDNIEDGLWKWMGPNWASISDEAKDLIKNMMQRDPKQRFTVDQCLQHGWIKGNAPDSELSDIKEELRNYQAKKRLKGAILGVMATNKMKVLMSSLKKEDMGKQPVSKPEPNPKNTKFVTEKKTASVASVVDFEVLEVVLLKGNNLAPKDMNGKSDPFLRVWCGNFKFKSKTMERTLDPVWDGDNVCSIPAAVAKANSIEIECWDWDLIGSSDFMGEFSFKSDIVGNGETVEKTFDLAKPREKNRKKTGSVSGSITVRITKK